jgi:hypothetical protein
LDAAWPADITLRYAGHNHNGDRIWVPDKLQDRANLRVLRLQPPIVEENLFELSLRAAECGWCVGYEEPEDD